MKLLLPREWISRNRSQRHIAAKYLPGFAPVNSEHDVFKFSDVAFKVKVNGKVCFKLGKVVVLRSGEGADIPSLNLKRPQNATFRCTLYTRKNDLYILSSKISVSSWKPVSSIISVVSLTGCGNGLSLTDSSATLLSGKGYSHAESSCTSSNVSVKDIDLQQSDVDLPEDDLNE